MVLVLCRSIWRYILLYFHRRTILFMRKSCFSRDKLCICGITLKFNICSFWNSQSILFETQYHKFLIYIEERIFSVGTLDTFEKYLEYSSNKGRRMLKFFFDTAFSYLNCGNGGGKWKKRELKKSSACSTQLSWQK